MEGMRFRVVSGTGNFAGSEMRGLGSSGLPIRPLNTHRKARKRSPGARARARARHAMRVLFGAQNEGGGSKVG